MFNKNLTIEDRIEICKKIGFKIDEAISFKGGSHLFRNWIRNDTNPNLYIDFNTGLVKDFADNSYSGDIVNLYAKAKEISIGRAIHKIKKQFAINTTNNNNIKNNNKMSDSKQRFWDKNKLERMKFCHSLIKKVDIDKVTVCLEYDGILNKTLEYFNCGIYPNKFGDLQFGLSDKRDENKIKTMFAFPYATGCQLYNRDHKNNKFISNVKGSKSNESFFYKLSKKQKENNNKYQNVIIMKSPRECMNMWQSMDKKKSFVFGCASGENSFKLSNIMKKQFIQVCDENLKRVPMFFDCDNETAYKESLKNCKIVKEFIYNNISKDAKVLLINIHKGSNQKYKDFTDIVRNNIESFGDSNNKNLNMKQYIFRSLECIKKNENLFTDKQSNEIFINCVNNAEEIK